MRTFSARETEWLLELDGIELAAFWPRAIAFSLDWLFIGILFIAVATLGALTYLGFERLQGKSVSTVMHDVEKRSNGHVNIALGPGASPVSGASSAPPASSPTPAATHTPEPTQSPARGVHINKSEEGLGDEAAHLLNKVFIPILYFGVLLWRGKGRTPGKRLMKIRVVSIMHRHLSFWHSVERALGYGAAALELGFGFAQFFFHPYRRCAQDRLAETIVVTERSYQANQHKFAHPLIPDDA